MCYWHFKLLALHNFVKTVITNRKKDSLSYALNAGTRTGDPAQSTLPLLPKSTRPEAAMARGEAGDLPACTSRRRRRLGIPRPSGVAFTLAHARGVGP
jgi:hypothetical protein